MAATECLRYVSGSLFVPNQEPERSETQHASASILRPSSQTDLAASWRTSDFLPAP